MDNEYVSPWKTPWDYEGRRGADHWSELDHEYGPCNQGKEQSPIDIRGAQKADLPPLRFHSREGPLNHVINNRYTIRVNYPRGNANFLLVGDRCYELVQFHFHHPSEHSIEGRFLPMEAHLMYQTSDGKVAGVAVFIVPGQPNRMVETLWTHMPKSEGQTSVSGVTINPAAILPADTRGYFEYPGALTAPPCTEGVTWYVLKTPIDLSQAQIDTFAKLYPNDVRPIQPLNGRVIRESD